MFVFDCFVFGCLLLLNSLLCERLRVDRNSLMCGLFKKTKFIYVELLNVPHSSWPMNHGLLMFKYICIHFSFVFFSVRLLPMQYVIWCRFSIPCLFSLFLDFANCSLKISCPALSLSLSLQYFAIESLSPLINMANKFVRIFESFTICQDVNWCNRITAALWLSIIITCSSFFLCSFSPVTWFVIECFSSSPVVRWLIVCYTV